MQREDQGKGGSGSYGERHRQEVKKRAEEREKKRKEDLAARLKATREEGERRAQLKSQKEEEQRILKAQRAEEKAEKEREKQEEKERGKARREVKPSSAETSASVQPGEEDWHFILVIPKILRRKKPVTADLGLASREHAVLSRSRITRSASTRQPGSSRTAAAAAADTVYEEGGASSSNPPGEADPLMGGLHPDYATTERGDPPPASLADIAVQLEEGEGAGPDDIPEISEGKKKSKKKRKVVCASVATTLCCGIACAAIPLTASVCLAAIFGITYFAEKERSSDGDKSSDSSSSSHDQNPVLVFKMAADPLDEMQLKISVDYPPADNAAGPSEIQVAQFEIDLNVDLPEPLNDFFHFVDSSGKTLNATVQKSAGVEGLKKYDITFPEPVTIIKGKNGTISTTVTYADENNSYITGPIDELLGLPKIGKVTSNAEGKEGIEASDIPYAKPAGVSSRRCASDMPQVQTGVVVSGLNLNQFQNTTEALFWIHEELVTEIYYISVDFDQNNGDLFAGNPSVDNTFFFKLRVILGWLKNHCEEGESQAKLYLNIGNRASSSKFVNLSKRPQALEAFCNNLLTILSEHPEVDGFVLGWEEWNRYVKDGGDGFVTVMQQVIEKLASVDQQVLINCPLGLVDLQTLTKGNLKQLFELADGVLLQAYQYNPPPPFPSAAQALPAGSQIDILPGIAHLQSAGILGCDNLMLGFDPHGFVYEVLDADVSNHYGYNTTGSTLEGQFGRGDSLYNFACALFGLCQDGEAVPGELIPIQGNPYGNQTDMQWFAYKDPAGKFYATAFDTATTMPEKWLANLDSVCRGAYSADFSGDTRDGKFQAGILGAVQTPVVNGDTGMLLRSGKRKLSMLDSPASLPEVKRPTLPPTSTTAKLLNSDPAKKTAIAPYKEESLNPEGGELEINPSPVDGGALAPYVDPVSFIYESVKSAYLSGVVTGAALKTFEIAMNTLGEKAELKSEPLKIALYLVPVAAIALYSTASAAMPAYAMLSQALQLIVAMAFKKYAPTYGKSAKIAAGGIAAINSIFQTTTLFNQDALWLVSNLHYLIPLALGETGAAAWGFGGGEALICWLADGAPLPELAAVREQLSSATYKTVACLKETFWAAGGCEEEEDLEAASCSMN
jgi:hypothetical protein